MEEMINIDGAYLHKDVLKHIKGNIEDYEVLRTFKDLGKPRGDFKIINNSNGHIIEFKGGRIS